jgi:hypothetical protein
LRAVESSLVSEPGSCQFTSEWVDICSILATAIEPNCTGLQEISLTIEGQVREGGSKLLDTKAEWVEKGLGRFKCLQRLELVVASDTVHIGAAENFKSRLAETLRGVQIVIKAIMSGSVILL